jgi:hypothetical protein
MFTEQTGAARRGQLSAAAENSPAQWPPAARGENRSNEPGEKVDSLIKGIMQLYMQVSTRLLQFRVDRSASTGGEAADTDVAKLLIARVREHAADSGGAGNMTASSSAAGSVRSEASAEESADEPMVSGADAAMQNPSALPNELSLHLARGPKAGGLRPRIGEQLKRRTFDYINQALDLAKQGKIESAETCAKLAESALRTAAEYLSAEEFLAFKNEVRSRVQRNSDEPG